MSPASIDLNQLVIQQPYTPLSIEMIQQMRVCYETKNHAGLSDIIITILRVLDQPRHAPFNAQELSLLQVFLKMLQLFLQDPEYQLDGARLFELVPHASLIGNAMKYAGLGTTDEAIVMLNDKPDLWARQLILYSLHNHRSIDLAVAAKHNPTLLTLWWDRLIENQLPLIDESMFQRACDLLVDPVIRQHFTFFHGTQNVAGSTANYLQTSYVDLACDASVKEMINRSVESYLSDRINTRPDIDSTPRAFDTIVVISRFYFYPHAVYRSLSPFIDELHGQYNTILISLVDPQTSVKVAADGFAQHYTFTDMDACIQTITQDIRPGVILYPDIGLSIDSIMLSNIRLAPIQVTGYGHPISTHCSSIDYFIGSQDTEPTHAQEHYSEKLVLIPGLAAAAVEPDYQPAHPPLSEDEIYISLAWGSHKTTLQQLNRLIPLFERTQKPLRFVFTGARARGMVYYHFQQELDKLLGSHRYIMFPYTPNHDYYQIIEACHFGIDAYPFGSFNRIVDSLHCARPIMVREGDHFVNRAAASALRMLELDELIAQDDESMLEIAVRLVEDDGYRESLSERIRGVNIKDMMNDERYIHGYLGAMKAIISNYHSADHKNGASIVIPDQSEAA